MDYPKTNSGYPTTNSGTQYPVTSSGYYPVTSAGGKPGQPEPKKENKLKKFFYKVFVHNALLKVTAIVISGAMWVLSVGLG